MNVERHVLRQAIFIRTAEQQELGADHQTCAAFHFGIARFDYCLIEISIGNVQR